MPIFTRAQSSQQNAPYSTRSNNNSSNGSYTEQKEKTDEEFKTQANVETLFQLSNNNAIVLTDNMKNHFKSHQYKCNMVACSIPLANERCIRCDIHTRLYYINGVG